VEAQDVEALVLDLLIHMEQAVVAVLLWVRLDQVQFHLGQALSDSDQVR
jgi:hypothetical protein